MKKQIIVIFLLLIGTIATAQSPLDTLAMRAIMVNQLFPQERVYLHFDNTAYYLGETMWFKAYVTSGIADEEKPISKVLYVELCAPEGYVVETKKYKLDENGYCYGEFDLRPSLLSGYYEVRAYTRYMLNWGDEAVFSRVFPVYDKVNGDNYDFKNMLDRKRSFMYRGEWMTNELPEAELRFYPEGGHLVDGIETTVAYELKGYDGVHGSDTIIILADGEEILRTVPTLMGMGSIKLLPRRGVKYRAHVTMTRHKNGKRKTFRFDLPKVEKEGVALSAKKADGNINITIKNNIPATADLGCVIANNGYIQLYEAFTSDEKEKKIQMPLHKLAEGVNRVILFGDSVPLAERQFFVTHDSIAAGDISTLKLTAKINGRDPKEVILQPHEKITLTVEREDGKPIARDAEFSLSVSDVANRQKISYEHNMYTHTLLGSQLKGYIADAARYFDPENPRREEELDLLMLTHGWTSYDWSKLARSHIDVRHHAEEGIELSGEIYTREKNQKWGQWGTYLLYPMKYGTMNFKFISDSINYKFHTTHNGRFRIRTDNFYGNKIAELSEKYNPFKTKNTIGIRFVLDRYFSPTFRFFDYWERTPGKATIYNFDNDTIAIQKDPFSYQLSEVNIVEEKRKDKRNRPPRSEIIFNFVDEWEYAQDVTYFNLNRDFDTTRVKVSLNFADINNIEQEKSNNAIENKNNGFKPIHESGKGNVFNALSDFYGSPRYATPYFYGVTNSLTSAQVLRSVFWRYNFNWAYWVQFIVVKGDYNSHLIPENDTLYLKKRPKNDIKYMMSFKEFTIRSDEQLRKQFTNEARKWFNDSMPRALDSLLTEGFLTRHYIPTQGNKMIDGFPGTLIFHQRMRGTSIHGINDSKRRSEHNNFPRKKPMPEFVARGRLNPEHPNYVACFIPYSKEEKETMEIPDFSKADKIRYTMLRGYSESKQFYAPDYSREKPDKKTKDYRRTLLWSPASKSDSSGKVELTLFNGTKTKYIDIDIQGRGKNSIYGNAANIITREKADNIEETTVNMEIWKKLSRTELPPTIIAKCNNITRDGVIFYVNKEYEKAIKSFREAAKYGYAPALANIGKCYYDGRGINENKLLAMRYFEMAADKGNSLAMHSLGDIFHEGEITTKNDSLAYEYYQKAAENNFAASQRMMGRFHEEGIYVDKDREMALKWYNLAATHNDPDALYKVGIYIVELDSIKGLSKRQLRKSQAIDYMRKAARGGNKDAQRFIVKCFAEGKYLKKSRKKSFEWMKSIAELGDEDAIMYVAYCHEKGRGTDVNHPLAYKLYKKLAERGNEFAIAKVYEFDMLKFFMYNSPKPPGVK